MYGIYFGTSSMQLPGLLSQTFYLRRSKTFTNVCILGYQEANMQSRAFNVGPTGMSYSSPSATSGGGQSSSQVCFYLFHIGSVHFTSFLHCSFLGDTKPSASANTRSIYNFYHPRLFAFVYRLSLSIPHQISLPSPSASILLSIKVNCPYLSWRKGGLARM